MSIEKRLLTVEEFSEYMNEAKGTTYNKVRAGVFLPGLVHVPGRGKRPSIRFDKTAIDKWLADHAEEGR